MRIAVLCIGSRGDVEPYAALAGGLRDAGHAVTLATHPRYQWIAAEAGVAVLPLAEGDLSRGAETTAGQAWIRRGSAREPAWVGMVRDAWSVAGQRLLESRAAVAGADVVVASPLATLLGHQASQDLGLPLVRALTAPLTPLAPDSALAARPRSRPLDRVRQAMARQVLWTAARPWVNAMRRRAALPALPAGDPVRALERRGAPVLFGFSPAVFGRRADWGPHVHVTGYWFHDRLARRPMPAAVEAFLGAGAPPVVVRFDSVAGPAGPAVAPLVLSAVERAGVRAIVLTGRARLDGVTPPGSVLVTDDVPLGALLPRAGAVVHHAGAGSTAAGIRAGIPSVVVPTFGDQPFWARCVERLGVGPPAIPRRDLTADGLAAALRDATRDAGLRRRAAALGARVRAEDGVARAVEAFERETQSLRRQ